MTKVTVTASGSSTDHTFAYDALGRRESMTSGGTTTDYLYEGLKVLVEKTNAVTKTYTNGPQAVGGIVCQEEGGDTTYYHYDAIGNVLLTSDGDGYVDETFVQDAWGNVISGTASGYHLTTKEYFPAFGLYYFNARWYDPEIGRFVSRDPIGILSGDVNLYRYCMNDPVNIVDIDGKQTRGLGGGRCCVDEKCKKDEPACKIFPEDEDWKNWDKWRNSPKPGDCVDCDLIGTPNRTLKVGDNCTCTVKCGDDGKPTHIHCTCFRIPWLAPGPELNPPGAPPNPYN